MLEFFLPVRFLSVSLLKNMERQKWTVEDFKKYVRQRIDKYYWDTPSMIVLRSFYVADVQKPEGVTLTEFTMLRGIAVKEIMDYKTQLNKPK
jgi:hypothetical protein